MHGVDRRAISIGHRCPAAGVNRGGRWSRSFKQPGRLTLVVCPDISNVQKHWRDYSDRRRVGADAMVLGSSAMIRLAAGDPRFEDGVSAADPSIGNLVEDMQRLRSEWKIELAASVLSESAEPPRKRAGRSDLEFCFGMRRKGSTSSMFGIGSADHDSDESGIDSRCGYRRGDYAYHFTREDSVCGA